MKRKPKGTQSHGLPPEVTPEQVISYLATISKPASIREIAHGLELKHGGRRFLPRIVQQLKSKGEIEEVHDRYRLAGSRHPKQKVPAKETVQAEQPVPAKPRPQPSHDPNLIAGRVVAHREG